MATPVYSMSSYNKFADLLHRARTTLDSVTSPSNVFKVLSPFAPGIGGATRMLDANANQGDILNNHQGAFNPPPAPPTPPPPQPASFGQGAGPVPFQNNPFSSGTQPQPPAASPAPAAAPTPSPVTPVVSQAPSVPMPAPRPPEAH